MEGDSSKVIGSKVPMFDGKNYMVWAERMKVHIQAISIEVWLTVEKGYTPYSTADDYNPTPLDIKKANFNSRAKNAILSGLEDKEAVKVFGLSTAKEMWDKLKSAYEGDKHIKEARLQVLRLRFEQLKMGD
ncbi:retrotransposon gag domain-containing protein, partial [Serratia marcescens]|nr:retrotransposon gag domain-containing protein [Serratia marcescens]